MHEQQTSSIIYADVPAAAVANGNDGTKDLTSRAASRLSQQTCHSAYFTAASVRAPKLADRWVVVVAGRRGGVSVGGVRLLCGAGMPEPREIALPSDLFLASVSVCANVTLMSAVGGLDVSHLCPRSVAKMVGVVGGGEDMHTGGGRGGGVGLLGLGVVLIAVGPRTGGSNGPRLIVGVKEAAVTKQINNGTGFGGAGFRHDEIAGNLGNVLEVRGNLSSGGDDAVGMDVRVTAVLGKSPDDVHVLIAKMNMVKFAILLVTQITLDTKGSLGSGVSMVELAAPKGAVVEGSEGGSQTVPQSWVE